MARLKWSTHKGRHWKYVEIVPEDKYQEIADFMGIKLSWLRKYFWDKTITMRTQLLFTMAVNNVLKTNYCHHDLFKKIIEQK